MKRIIPIALLSAVALSLSCRNPFTIGLGNQVDIQSPDLAVTSYSNGQYVKGDIDLAGTFADDFQNVTVRVSLDGGSNYSPADVNPDTHSWTYHLLTTAQADGARDIIVRVTDGSGKSIEKRILLYFDNTPPVVLVKVPLGYVYPPNEYNGTVSIRGDAVDQFPIQRVALEIQNASGGARLSPLGHRHQQLELQLRQRRPGRRH
jgi:hypothetical protein